MSLFLCLEEKIYKAKNVGSLEKIIFYPDNLLFVYFSSGIYQIWDILYDKFITDGMIEKDIKYLKYFSKSEIAYYSFPKQELKILNIFERKEKKLAATVPTKQAISDSERSEQAIKTLYDEGTSFETLPLSGFGVLFEQRNNIINSNDNIITIFDEESTPFYYQTVYTNNIMKKLFLSLVNNRDTIMVWGDDFNDRPLEFYILNIQKKDSGFKVVTMHNNSINCQLIQAMGWGTKEIILFGNYNAGYPFIKIVDYIEEKETMSIELKQEIRGVKHRILTEVYQVYQGNYKLAVFTVAQHLNNFMVFFDLESGKFEAKKNVESGGIKRIFSEFKMQFVQWEAGESCNKMENFSFKVSPVIEKKLWLLYVLERKKIVQRYGKWVTQEILNFLA
jgi:hypothetical protein